MDPHKQAEAAIFISDNVNFRPKSNRRESEDHFILITGTIHQEQILSKKKEKKKKSKYQSLTYMHQTQRHPYTFKKL
jgi:hypothetical protein